MEASNVSFASELPTTRPSTAAHMVCRTADARLHSASSPFMLDLPYTPFSVEPTAGNVLPGKSATIKVRFSPLDVNSHSAKLIARCHLLY